MLACTYGNVIFWCCNTRTDEHADGQTDGRTDRQIDRHRKTDRKKGRLTGSGRGGLTNKQTKKADGKDGQTVSQSISKSVSPSLCLSVCLSVSHPHSAGWHKGPQRGSSIVTGLLRPSRFCCNIDDGQTDWFLSTCLKSFSRSWLCNNLWATSWYVMTTFENLVKFFSR